MRTMFFAEEKIYTDCEGRNTAFVVRGQFDTLEDAKAVVATFPPRKGWNTGEWKIVAKTMDEATFTITEEIIEEYSFNKGNMLKLK